ncbi:pentatricopeptide repeat-containing protein-like [Forsythia ovata]|uniref:Pentatricopeptide repeat-containing protein-like n=1 Tax=Forsythia ovata TaxID=205694 RepID=A0ABD1WKR2_9LAMI
MKDKKIRKLVLGSSMIEVDGIVHEFSVKGSPEVLMMEAIKSVLMDPIGQSQVVCNFQKLKFQWFMNPHAEYCRTVDRGRGCATWQWYQIFGEKYKAILTGRKQDEVVAHQIPSDLLGLGPGPISG